MKNIKIVFFLSFILVLLAGFSGCKPETLYVYHTPKVVVTTFAPAVNLSSQGDTAKASNVSVERKIVYKSSIELQTKNFDDTIKKIENACNASGAYIETSEVQGQRLDKNDPRVATYTFRVPVANQDNFKNGIKNSGNVIADNVSSEDVTGQYFDTEGRLIAAKAHRDNLLKLAEKATNLTDLITLQKEIATVEAEIESLSGTNQKLDSLSALSTVNVKVTEYVEAAVEPTEAPVGYWSQVGGTFQSSVDFILSTLKTILLVLTWLSPFIVAAAVILLIVFRKRVLKRKKHDKVIVASNDNKKDDITID